MKLAGCILKDRHGRVLLLHRHSKGADQWEVPGGKLENTEDPKAAAIREVKEEVGVDVKIIKLLGARDFTERDRVLHYSWYLAKITDGKISIGEPQTFDDAKYFSLDEMHAIKLSAGASAFVRMIETGEIKL